VGAEEFYTAQDGGSRNEALEQAQELDRRLVDAWVGHPHFSIIENRFDSFQKKIEAV
jgi:hypothetical protein